MKLEPLHIVVMRGGLSAEREVSLRTGAAVADALRSRNHSVTEVDPKSTDFKLPSGVDVVFLALHGTFGEDGTIQTELESRGLPYTGSGPEGSRVAFDKIESKKRFLAEGIPTPRSRSGTFTPEEKTHVNGRAASLIDELRFPLVFKPARQGSSVGLQFVDNPADAARAAEKVLEFDDTVLVEERVMGRELTVSVLENEVLPVVEIRPRRGAYTYENKYTQGATEYFCPAELDPGVTARVQAVGLAAFRAVGARDYGRVDVMLDGAGRPFVLEVNTLPGMTATSLLPKAAAARGICYAELCERMARLALSRKTS
jgi:D-alanine-D-alanine ligase